MSNERALSPLIAYCRWVASLAASFRIDMPRYFFDLAHERPELDREGVVLSDDAMAREEAIRFAGEYVVDHPEMLRERPIYITVSSAHRDPLFTIEVTAKDLT